MAHTQCSYFHVKMLVNAIPDDSYRQAFYIIQALNFLVPLMPILLIAVFSSGVARNIPNHNFLRVLNIIKTLHYYEMPLSSGLPCILNSE